MDLSFSRIDAHAPWQAPCGPKRLWPLSVTELHKKPSRAERSQHLKATGPDTYSTQVCASVRFKEHASLNCFGGQRRRKGMWVRMVACQLTNVAHDVWFGRRGWQRWPWR